MDYRLNFTLLAVIAIIFTIMSTVYGIDIRLVSTTEDKSSSIHVTLPLTSPMTTEGEEEEEEDLPNNAPLRSCGSAGGVEDGQYITVQKQYMDPVCEDVQGYCRLRRNQNYTAILRFTPKVEVQSLTVRVTAVQFGVETLFWPEYGICGRFNLTCPQEADVTVQAFNHDEVPEQAPPTRGLFRLRLLGTRTGDETKKPYLCRQIYLQLY